MNDLLERLQRIEAKLDSIVSQQTIQEFYSTVQVAQLLDRSTYSVREWCRLGRVRAEKRRCGRGNTREWMVSHAELLRIRSEGLLPLNGTALSSRPVASMETDDDSGDA